MSNLTEALIAAKLVGGSGGSGGGSGLPEIRTETVTVVEEQTVTFTNDEGAFVGELTSISPLLAGDNYSVSWDGAVYTCTAFVQKNAILIGNLGIMGGPDTGEPFIIGYFDSMMTAYTQSTLESHLIEIVGETQTPSDGSVPIVENGEWTANPIEVFKTVTGISGVSITVQAGAIADVNIRNLPTLDHAYAAIRIAKTTEGAIPLIVLSGAFSGNVATFKVYNPTTESVYFGRDNQVSVTGIMM